MTDGTGQTAATATGMDDLLARLGDGLASSIHEITEARGELSVIVRREDLLRVISFLRDDPACLFTQLMDICGVDYPGRPERFEVVYNLLSPRRNRRIRVKVTTDEDTPVPSVVEFYPAGGWFEREVWDMYGVTFSGNPDLRRILTDYGFDGHPQRKDFPLTGYVELRYDPEQQRVVYEPVKLPQAYRSFDFMSPWEGAENLPQLLTGGIAQG